MMEMNEPWKDEPNFAEWEVEGTDLMVTRNLMGALCGYVVLDECDPAPTMEECEKFRVHGGVTWHGLWDIDGKRRFAIGFDCAHLTDLLPCDHRVAAGTGRVYRDMGFVKAETEKLAWQYREWRALWRP